MSTHALAYALRMRAAMEPKPIKLLKAPRARWPLRERMEYYRVLLAMVDRVQGIVRAKVVPALQRIVAEHNITRPEEEPVRVDTAGDNIEGLFDEVAADVEAAVPDQMIQTAASRMAINVSLAQGRELQRQVEHVAKINVWGDTVGLAEHLELAVNDNVKLIKSLTGGHLDDLKGIVLRGARAGVHQSVIAEQLEQRLGMAKKRAALIANDQVGKLNGELNAIRQQRLGVRRYRWSSSQDERVRPRHRQLNGTIQEWAKPPVVDDRTGERGHPGQPIRCRCQPIPLVDDVLADLGLLDPSDIETGMPAPGKRPRTPVKVPPMPPANTPAAAAAPARKRASPPAVPPALPQPPPANKPPPAKARRAAKPPPPAQPGATTEPGLSKAPVGARKPPRRPRKPPTVPGAPTVPPPPNVAARIGEPPAWMLEAAPSISRNPADKIKKKGASFSEVLSFATPQGERKALWKPLDADRSWTHGSENAEAAAAAFDRLLHTPQHAVVPNTVVRQIEGARGSLQELVQGVVGDADDFKDGIASDPTRWANLPSVRKTFLSDVLTRNVDRHSENLLFTKSGGEYVGHAIDNGYSFRTLGAYEKGDVLFAFPSNTDAFVRSLMELDAASIETLKRIDPAQAAEVLRAHELEPPQVLETLIRARSLQKKPDQLKALIGKDASETRLNLSKWLGQSAEAHGLTESELSELRKLSEGR